MDSIAKSCRCLARSRRRRVVTTLIIILDSGKHHHTTDFGLFGKWQCMFTRNYEYFQKTSCAGTRGRNILQRQREAEGIARITVGSCWLCSNSTECFLYHDFVLLKAIGDV